MTPESGPASEAGAWRGRPPGIPSGVPPPSVPLSFFVAAALGLVACGAALVWSSGRAVVDPTDDRVVAAAHLAMLATLSMGVLGALHQFIPVITQRSLRSVAVSRATFALWLAGAWALPIGFGTRHEWLVEAGGACLGLAVAALVANVSAPLSVRGKGVPVMGLRLAVGGLTVTAGFGIVYVIDRRAQWFDLVGHVVLAHAVIGLFAWLGLAYVSVAEKLWPMFLLAHVPGRRRAPWVTVRAVPVGVALLSPGLLLGAAWLAWGGAAILALGLGAHLTSLAGHVRHRRRGADLHLVFLLTSASWLVVAAGLALAAALVIPSHHHAGVALVAGSVAATSGWLLVALVGHSHKVVPFILWSALRARGVSAKADGTQLMFADLFDPRLAVVVFALTTAGVAAVCLGLSASLAGAVAAGGVLLMAAGIAVAVNLAATPLRLVRASGAPARDVARAPASEPAS